MHQSIIQSVNYSIGQSVNQSMILSAILHINQLSQLKHSQSSFYEASDSSYSSSFFQEFANLASTVATVAYKLATGGKDPPIKLYVAPQKVGVCLSKYTRHCFIFIQAMS